MFPGSTATYASSWLISFGLISAGVAAFLLIQAKDYKRLFAFSTVEHMGIILVAAGLGGFSAHFAAMLQIVAHALTKSLCFFAAGATLLATGTRSIPAIRGLIRISPVAGIFLMVARVGDRRGSSLRSFFKRNLHIESRHNGWPVPGYRASGLASSG